HKLFVLALNHPGSAARAIKNRWFAPPVEFLRLFWRKTPQKSSFTPFPFSGRGQGDGLSGQAQTGYAMSKYV
ncbi:MAG: hypothetical protein NTW32_13275, partial [Chloroflexi bacterium]|nr:hypothetical protein [Chloroflexota bacterium]